MANPMDDIFSKEEIEGMFREINGDAIEPKDAEPTGKLLKIKIYDFKRPNRFSEKHIQALTDIHETLARSLTKLFSQFTQDDIKVNFCSVDSLTYEEFNRSIPTPTSLIISEGIFNSVPLPLSFMIEIDPKNPIPSKTDLNKICKPLLDEYSKIWNNFPGINLEFNLKSMGTNPQLIQIDSPSEMGILITMEANSENSEGMVNIWLPYLFLRPLLPYLEGMDKTNNPATKPYKETNMINNDGTIIEKGLDNLNVQVIAEFGRTVKKLKDIKETQEGAIIELDNIENEPLKIFVNNVLFAHAEAVVINDHFGIRIVEIFDQDPAEQEQSS
ncbi:MAG: FliM/FliN family flagellar motor switch protein [Treponema sp.]|nr:FliM/FliN family flagellar motor switch protein [Treponema sp.]